MQENSTPETTPEAPTDPTPVDTTTPTDVPASEPIAPPVAPLSPTEAPTTPPALSAPKKGVPKIAKIIIGIVLGLIVLIGIGVIALFLIVNAATQAPVKVSNQFFDDLQANQPAAAYELTSTEFKASTTEAQVEDLFTQLSPLTTGTEKVTGKKIESANGVTQAAVTYSVENGGTTRYARIVLRETNNKWEVINIKTSSTVLDTTIE